MNCPSLPVSSSVHFFIFLGQNRSPAQTRTKAPTPRFIPLVVYGGCPPRRRGIQALTGADTGFTVLGSGLEPELAAIGREKLRIFCGYLTHPMMASYDYGAPFFEKALRSACKAGQNSFTTAKLTYGLRCGDFPCPLC